MRIEFNKNPLAAEQNNFLTKTQKFYIKKLFGGTNVVKNNDKGKYVYSGHGIVFNGKGESAFEFQLQSHW